MGIEFVQGTLPWVETKKTILVVAPTIPTDGTDPNLQARVDMLLTRAQEYETSHVYDYLPPSQRAEIAQAFKSQAEALRTGIPLMVDNSLQAQLKY